MPGANQPSMRMRRPLRRARPAWVFACAAISILALDGSAAAQTLSLDLGPGGVTERALQLVALVTVLALAPSILIMVTSFTRIVVVLSLLRAAIGTQTAPPNAVIVSLAMFLTAFVMAPTFREAYRVGGEPLVAGQIQPAEAFERAAGPFRAFGGCRPAGARAGLHDLGAEARLRDRLPALRALPDHRSRGRVDPDVGRHDDAAAGDGRAAFQADLLRARRRLEPRRRLARPELRKPQLFAGPVGGAAACGLLGGSSGAGAGARRRSATAASG
jgi:hypothetical protein